VPVNDGVRGYNIFARSEGKSRKENEVVLLLHGGGYYLGYQRDHCLTLPFSLVVPVSSYVYRKMLPLLSEAGLFAVAFDFPGLGLSDKPKGLSYDWHYLAGSALLFLLWQFNLMQPCMRSSSKGHSRCYGLGASASCLT